MKTKIYITLGLVIIQMFVVLNFAYAATVTINGTYNVTTTSGGGPHDRPTTTTTYNLGYTNYTDKEKSNESLTIKKLPSIASGGKIHCTGTLDGDTLKNATCKKGYVDSADNGVSSKAEKTYEKKNPSSTTADGFTLFGKKCNNTASPIECWINEVYNWSKWAMYTIAVLAVIFGGILYMTSAGNPQQVGRAKNVILGALTGVAIIILAKFFLTYVLGVNG